jgi:uncharacterized RDD family membrane protein YckC
MTNPTDAGVLRRLAAMFYDALLTLAIWLVANGVLLLFTGGKAVASGNPLMTLYLLSVTFLFFGWFWTHGGQTLGMRAWRMRLQRRDGGALSWPRALGRFLTAVPAWALFIFGIIHSTIPAKLHLPTIIVAAPHGTYLLLATVWLIIDNRAGTWRERVTDTRVVVLPKS